MGLSEKLIQPTGAGEATAHAMAPRTVFQKLTRAVTLRNPNERGMKLAWASIQRCQRTIAIFASLIVYTITMSLDHVVNPRKIIWWMDGRSLVT